ncbi:hypothetical protein [Streptomyces sp. NPDC088400]|uniref:hypothetical protein n=1 Tax=Streptomyces sp. NPDC088400 TaxID=3365861 RepID=UPI00380B2B49
MSAENAVLNSPLGDEPLISRESVAEAEQTVHRPADLTYKEMLIIQIVADEDRS